MAGDDIASQDGAHRSRALDRARALRARRNRRRIATAIDLESAPASTTDDDASGRTTPARAVEMRSLDADDGDASDAEDDDRSMSSGSEDSELAFSTAEPTTFSWRAEFSRWKKRDAKVVSQTFECGDTLFRLAMYPFGSNLNSKSETPAQVSLFLDTGATKPRRIEDDMSREWRRHAKFELQLLHPTDASVVESKETSHTFDRREADWGFASFITREDVFEKGYVDAEGCVNFRVHVTPIEEHEVDRPMQSAFYSEYDSRKETGLIGLKNQGATCYMNSLLQTLYHIPSFRRAVYHMPTNETEEAHTSMPLALQSVFYCLQYAKEGDVSTEDLTRSFGWDSYDSFMQHDVQELNRVLQDKLEEAMKQTCVEGTIQKLFEGHTTNFIECINVDYKSERKEEFLDLQLDVKGCKDIYASFDRYTEIEKLDGENKYRAEGHGLQDARKGTLFHDFPPVLQIQLKRFEYDYQRDTMVKIHDRYEFPEELDLDVGDRKYLVPESDKSVRNKYKLHSVLVHSGGINGGHYYAFVKPNLQAEDAQWFKFDDEHVTKETAEKSVVEQYGSGGAAAVDSDMDADDDSTNVRVAPNLRFQKVSSAYMLVYIREDDMDQIMCVANKSHLTEYLQARFAEEQKAKEKEAQEKKEAHLYTIIKVLTRQDLERQIASEKFFDLGNFESAQRFRLHKKSTFTKFRELVSEKLGIPAERQRYWTYSPRRNKTSRPATALPDHANTPPTWTVEKTRLKYTVPNSQHASSGEFRLYLEELDDDAFANSDPERDIWLHVKLYNPHEARLSYCGTLYASPEETLSTYMPKIKSMAGFASTASTLMFEEIAFVRESKIQIDQLSDKQVKAYPLSDPDDGSKTLQLGNGDILLIQPEITEDMEDSLKFPNVVQYADFRHNHQIVHFRELEVPKVDKVTLELTKMMSYDQVADVLASAIGLDDPLRLRFTAHHVYTNGPKSASFQFRGADTLIKMLENQQSDVLYYEVLDMPLPELQELKTLKVFFHGLNTKLVEEFQLRLSKSAAVKDVLEEVRSRLGTRVGGRKLRLLELFYSQIYKVFEEEKDIADINDQYWTLRAEEVPDDESEEDRLLRVYNISKDLSNPNQFYAYDEPMLLRTCEGETLGEVKARIKTRLEATDEDFAKWKFYIGHPPRYEILDDDELVISSKLVRIAKEGFCESTLGIEREVRGPRRPASRQGKPAGFERAIKIM